MAKQDRKQGYEWRERILCMIMKPVNNLCLFLRNWTSWLANKQAKTSKQTNKRSTHASQKNKTKQQQQRKNKNKKQQLQKQHNLHKISCNIQLLISSFVWFAVDHTQVSGCSKDWACAPGSWQGKSLYMILSSLLEFLSLLCT